MQDMQRNESPGMYIMRNLFIITFSMIETESRRPSNRNSANQCLLNFRVPDHISLAIQWPPGVCYTSRRRCKSNIDHFTIHDAWPDYRNGSWPSTCCGQPFNGSLLGQHATQLQTVMPTLYPGSSHSFWKHEWEKHGTCALNARVRDQQSQQGT